MTALATARTAGTPAEFAPFLAAMAEAPGEATNLLVFADWLDEHERSALAEAVRVKAPLLVKRFRRVGACIDTMRAVDLERAGPVPMPRADRGRYRSRGQWCHIVRRALRPFGLAGVSVAAAPGWRGGSEVEVRLPGADFCVSDKRNCGFAVPWGLTSADMLTAGVLCFASLLPRLFPDETPRVVHDAGGSFAVPFWRCEIRPQP